MCIYVCLCGCTYTYKQLFFGVWLSAKFESLLFSYVLTLLFFNLLNCF